MDQDGRVHVVPAPFMVATFDRKPCLMPLGGGGVMDMVKAFLAKAGQVALRLPGVGDDGGGDHHSAVGLSLLPPGGG